MSLPSDADAQLMLAFQRGDKSAFAALFERYHTRVLNIAYHILGNDDAAQDVAQKVLIKVYTAPQACRLDSAFSTWLYSVTTNACLDEIRRRKRSRSVPLEELTERIVDPAASPQAHAESEELAGEIGVALASLPENQRIAVVLQRYEGLSYQQIADVMKTSVPAVESLLFRAKQALRTRLSPYVEGDDGNQSAGTPTR